MRILKVVSRALVVLLVCFIFMQSCGTDPITGTETDGTEEQTQQEEEQFSDGVVRLPVVFHVLYDDANDTNQYVDSDRITELIDNVNAFYKADTLDSNIQFYLCTTDEDGNKMPIAGVDYQAVNNSEYSCEDFMSGKISEAMGFFWDPNLVINIFVYAFTEENVLGITHLPLTQAGEYELAGTTAVSYGSLQKSNFGMPYGVSINSEYFYENTVINGNNIQYSDEDTSATLAHELGHFLGLLHVFSTEDDTLIYTDDLADIDYCEDTNLYSREEYSRYLELHNRFVYFDDYCKRTDTNTGESFISYNLMDYYYSYSNSFTPNQVERMTHMVTYGIVIPGVTSSKSRSGDTYEGVLDLPLRTYISTTDEGCKCSH